MHTLLRSVLPLLIAIGLSSAAMAAPPTARTIEPGVGTSLALIDYGSATSSSGCTLGVRGCLVSSTFSGVTSVSVVAGTNLAQPPYPAPVQVDLFDSGSNGTLACSAVKISGVNALGLTDSETISSLTESGAQSTRSWRYLRAVNATGCSGGGASDVFRVSLTERAIGLPVRVLGANPSLAASKGTGILRVCAKAGITGAWRCTDGTNSAITYSSGAAVIGAVSVGGAVIADGQMVTVDALGIRSALRLDP